MVYTAGFVLCVFGIISVLTDAAWVRLVMNAFKGGHYAYDLNRDGRDDYYEEWVGLRLILQEWDTNYDGPVDYRLRALGASGDLRDADTEYRLETDADFDGRFEYREHWDGNELIRAELDAAGDGNYQPIDVPDLESKSPRSADR